MKKAFRRALIRRREQLKMSFNFAFKNITRAKYRSFLLIFGVLLTVALETGIVISVDTLYDDFIFDNRGQNYTDITVNPKSWLELPTLKALANNVQQTPGVAKAGSVCYFSVSRLLDIEFFPKILVYGIDAKNHPDFTHIDMIRGSRSLSGNTIIISERIQEILNLKIGDTVDLSSAVSELNLLNANIGGVIPDKSIIGNNPGVLFILADIETVLSAISSDQRDSLLNIKIDISVHDLLKIKETAEKIEDKIGLNHYVFVEKDISDIKAAGIRAYQTAMNLVIIASFVVEFLFITNVLAIAIRDRQKEIGVLRAVGTKSWQLIEIIGIEILGYSIIGSFLGIFVGIGFSIILVNFMDVFYTSIEFQAISLHFSSILAIFFSGIIVALISGLYPIFLAKTIPIMQNIHSRMRRSKSSDILSGSTWKYTIGGGVILMITAFFLQLNVGPSRFLDFSILSVHFFTVLMIFFATILIEIGILIFLPRIAMKVLFWFGPVTRTISLRNVAREFQKSLFTIMTSAMALTFIIIVGSVSASIIAEVPDYFQEQWGGIDTIAEARDNDLFPINSTLLLDEKSAVERSAFIQETRTEIGLINGYIFGVDPEQYHYFAETVMLTDFTQPSSSLLDSSTENKTNGLVSNLLYQRLGVPMGENISVKIADNNTVDITLVAVVKANIFLGNGEYIYISSIQYQKFFNSTLAKWIVCKKSKEASTAKTAVERALPTAKEVIDVSYFTEVMEQTLTFQTAIFQVLFIESFILSAIAQFVCILVSTLRMEREMGIMRSVGLSKRGVFSIFMAESTALGFTGLIVGLLDGLIGSVLLIWYISFSLPIDLYFPPERIVFWIIISFLITIASTIIPSYRSSQKNVIATIYGRPMKKDYVEKPRKPLALDKKVGYYIDIFSIEKMPQKEEHERAITKTIGHPNSFQIGWQILKNNKVKIWKIYLAMMLIATLNYIIDQHLPIRGLILTDIVFFSLTGSLILVEYSYYDVSTLLNPLLFLVGLAAISSTSYYLSYNGHGKNLVKKAVESVILGLISIVVLFLIMICFSIVAFFPIFGLAALFLGQHYYYYDLLENLNYILSFFYVGIVLLYFQRIWVFLTYRGLRQNTSLKRQISWTRREASRGQLGFITLLFIHEFVRVILNIIFRTPIFLLVEQYGYQYVEGMFFPPLNPVSFVVLFSFEIGFFILLIIYQFVQFYKGGLLIPFEDFPVPNDDKN
ncbi:MAG: ABC transporter permease [Candidatus Hodarchaeota archaeon]